MPAYLIVNYTVEDPDLYSEYQQGAGTALQIGSGTDLVAFDPDSYVVEGDNVGQQTVILKFESLERAKEVYEGTDYQAVVGKRHAGTSNHFAVIVDGLA